MCAHAHSETDMDFWRPVNHDSDNLNQANAQQ